ncbi:hypothetical protein L7F22_016066 [Adiantum nelumboides]|nr:hypothetical protein [Adiantum nelumboides]
MKVGPGHLPVFKCLEVAGKVFAGEPAKTKKQAEKNAAMAAWLSSKQWAQPPAITSSVDDVCNDGERSNSSNALALYRRADNSSQMQPAQCRYGGRSMGVYQKAHLGLTVILISRMHSQIVEHIAIMWAAFYLYHGIISLDSRD